MVSHQVLSNAYMYPCTISCFSSRDGSIPLQASGRTTAGLRLDKHWRYIRRVRGANAEQFVGCCDRVGSWPSRFTKLVHQIIIRLGGLRQSLLAHTQGLERSRLSNNFFFRMDGPGSFVSSYTHAVVSIASIEFGKIGFVLVALVLPTSLRCVVARSEY